MAENATPKIDAAAEKAYAEAAARKVEAVKPAADVKPVPVDAPKAEAPKAEAKPLEPAKPAPVAAKAPAAAPAKRKKAVRKAKPVAARKAAPKKAAPSKTAAKAGVRKIAKPASKNTAPVPTITQLKEKIMATAKTTDFTKTAKELATEMQTRMKGAYEKSGELASEATEFSKANVEAMVEAGKIFVAGVQDLGREDLENGKTVVKTVTEDVKKMATVKSPTELVQMQGELARRNFDAMIAYGSKRTEALVKLYSEAFAPISSRVSVAAEKISKAA